MLLIGNHELADVFNQRIANPWNASVSIGLLVFLAGLSQPVADMPTIEVRPQVQVPDATPQRASKFMEEYFRHLSSPDVLSKFKQDYAALIDYYGKVVNRNTVMQEKTRFVQRWPQRDYRLRQNSIAVACKNETEKLCMVSGLVDFECRSSERHATSTGVARFDAAILFEEDSPRIIGESSKVVAEDAGHSVRLPAPPSADR